MFSGKLLAIVGAIFTVTAYGSPVKVVERELQAVRSVHILSASLS